MSCTRYEELISRYLDEAVGPRERQDLLAHLNDCPDCAATLARYRQAGVLLGRLPATTPAPRVREAVLAQGSKSRENGALRAALAGAVAVTIVVVAIVGFQGFGQRQLGAELAANATPSAKDALVGGDGQGVVDALRQSLAPGGGPALPRYIPRGATVERVSLGRQVPGSGPYEVDLSLRLEDGKSLLLRQRASEAKVYAPTPQARTVVIGGREWRYLPKYGTASRESATYVLAGELNGNRYELESSLPLEDLVRVAESIR